MHTFGYNYKDIQKDYLLQATEVNYFGYSWLYTEKIKTKNSYYRIHPLVARRCCDYEGLNLIKVVDTYFEDTDTVTYPKLNININEFEFQTEQHTLERIERDIYIWDYDGMNWDSYRQDDIDLSGAVKIPRNRLKVEQSLKKVVDELGR